MRQDGLIERCIEAVGLDNATTRDTPCRPGIPLTRDDEGEPALGDFNYASVVGMLMYLAGHTRPDIAYAVNCCARYMFNPKRSHEGQLSRSLLMTEFPLLHVESPDDYCTVHFTGTMPRTVDRTRT
ncbi:hypothetical protein THAOC_30426 [Thalassiosira oceanica]|uniref:Reverse transcriptase Ty1/copia-type domain-containing protein n=1 Tax=Thalassiosira oceanica TaxID=159749 RepID=K0RA80_THAOC|nr:hypothetical protein THAOC_30426 [Thalassiosira oceanica]|eukprot:EJK50548.1 hypothetical protein THAOC_30426 [Thalassiosira oceanica]